MSRAGITFGALADPLSKQFRDLGVRVLRYDVKHWQIDADAITRLLVRGLISESAGHAARTKLMKLIDKGSKLGAGEVKP